MGLEPHNMALPLVQATWECDHLCVLVTSCGGLSVCGCHQRLHLGARQRHSFLSDGALLLKQRQSEMERPPALSGDRGVGSGFPFVKQVGAC